MKSVWELLIHLEDFVMLVKNIVNYLIKETFNNLQKIMDYDQTVYNIRAFNKFSDDSIMLY